MLATLQKAPELLVAWKTLRSIWRGAGFILLTWGSWEIPGEARDRGDMEELKT